MSFHLDLEYSRDSAVWKEMLQHENLIEKRSAGALACTYGALPAPVLSHFLTHGHTHRALLPPHSAELLARAEAEGFRFGGRPGRHTGTKKLERGELYALTHSAFASEGQDGAAMQAQAPAASDRSAGSGSLGTQHHHSYLASSQGAAAPSPSSPLPAPTTTHAALGYLYPPSHPRHGGSLGGPYPRAGVGYARGPYYQSHVALLESAALSGLEPEPHPSYLRHAETSTYRRNTTGRRHDPFPAQPQPRAHAKPRERPDAWEEHCGQGGTRAVVVASAVQEQRQEQQQKQPQTQLFEGPSRPNALPALSRPPLPTQALSNSHSHPHPPQHRSWAPAAPAPPVAPYQTPQTARVSSAKAARYNGSFSARAHPSSASSAAPAPLEPYAPAFSGALAAPRPGVGVAAVAQIAVTHPRHVGFAEYALQQQQQQQQNQQQHEHPDSASHAHAHTQSHSHSPAPSLAQSLLSTHAARSTGQFNHRASFGRPGSFRAVPETRDSYHHGLHASTRLW